MINKKENHMGKLTSSDLDALQKAGIVDNKTAEGIKSKGLASVRRRTNKRYMRTSDGKWVSPTLYWRGAKDTKPSKKMEEFNHKFNKLMLEFTSERPATTK